MTTSQSLLTPAQAVFAHAVICSSNTDGTDEIGKACSSSYMPVW